MYDDTHRYFVNFLLSNPCIKLVDGLNFYKKCHAENKTVDDLDKFVQEINEQISNHCFKILTSKNEVNGEYNLILINTANDEVTKLQTEYSSINIEYFQTLVKEILSNDAKRLTYIHCLNISSTLKSTFSRHNAEIYLDKWFKEGYLSSDENYIYLGPRYINEFTSYLLSSCKDFVSTCVLCSEILVLGSACNSCNKKTHKYCLEKFLQKQNKCPSCKHPWEEKLHREIDNSQVSQQGTDDDED